VASSATNFIRFTGGAIAPFLAGKLAEHVSASAPLYVAGGAVTLGIMVLLVGRPILDLANHNAPQLSEPDRQEAFDEDFAAGVGV
jgi:ACDE family multidrug resistance protein